MTTQKKLISESCASRGRPAPLLLRSDAAHPGVTRSRPPCTQPRPVNTSRLARGSEHATAV
eukprot:5318640-Prymnesium_polylepis.1